MTLVTIPREQKVYFDGATEAAVAYVPPRDTTDPRARACTDHRVACDCREAEWAEYRSESVAERRHLREVAREVLAGHLTRAYLENQAPCQCTGCQIVRAAHIYI